MVYATAAQQHRFNMPYQLAQAIDHAPTDTAHDAVTCLVQGGGGRARGRGRGRGSSPAPLPPPLPGQGQLCDVMVLVARGGMEALNPNLPPPPLHAGACAAG